MQRVGEWVLRERRRYGGLLFFWGGGGGGETETERWKIKEEQDKRRNKEDTKDRVRNYNIEYIITRDFFFIYVVVRL